MKAWLRRTASDRAFFLLADPDHVSRCARNLDLPVPVAAVEPEEAAAAFSSSLPVAPLKHRIEGIPGQPAPHDAKGTIEAIDRAVQLIRSARAAAMVTNPITKASLYQTGFQYPGHTEYLGELAQTNFGEAVRPVMLLWSPDLAVVPVTIHVPLTAAISLLTGELIVATGRVTASAMHSQFGISSPRLAFSGLNPHAGEGGTLGREEIEIIAPAIEQLRSSGIDARGPLPADTMFHAQAREQYDVALCMYHDQALIPVKTLAFDTAVNVTIGLPFVRTSPDHGTAHDIAGQGIARSDSLESAIQLAAQLAENVDKAAP